MQYELIRRDQFDITPQGIIHKPTDAAFIPDLADPHSGNFRLGQLGNEKTNGNFQPEEVKRMLRELWIEYVASSNLRRLKAAANG
jgi:hypothetical protein